MPRDISYDIADAAGKTPQSVRIIAQELHEKLIQHGKIVDGKLVSLVQFEKENTKRVFSCQSNRTSPPCPKDGDLVELQGGVFP